MAGFVFFSILAIVFGGSAIFLLWSAWRLWVAKDGGIAAKIVGSLVVLIGMVSLFLGLLCWAFADEALKPRPYFGSLREPSGSCEKACRSKV